MSGENYSDFNVSQVCLKCKKCRKNLVHGNELVDCHGDKCSYSIEDTCDDTPACSMNESTIWYIKEDSAVEWLNDQLNKGQWIKGKLFCPKCNLRIGSYNFVNETVCPCGLKPLPPVHIAKSKVDLHNPTENKALLERIQSLQTADKLPNDLCL